MKTLDFKRPRASCAQDEPDNDRYEAGFAPDDDLQVSALLKSFRAMKQARQKQLIHEADQEGRPFSAPAASPNCTAIRKRTANDRALKEQQSGACCTGFCRQRCVGRWQQCERCRLSKLHFCFTTRANTDERNDEGQKQMIAGEQHQRVLYRPSSVPAKIPERPNRRQRRTDAARTAGSLGLAAVHDTLPAVPEDAAAEDAVTAPVPTIAACNANQDGSKQNTAQLLQAEQVQHDSGRTELCEAITAIQCFVGGGPLVMRNSGSTAYTVLAHALASEDATALQLLAAALLSSWQVLLGSCTVHEPCAVFAASLIGACNVICAARWLSSKPGSVCLWHACCVHTCSSSWQQPLHYDVCLRLQCRFPPEHRIRGRRYQGASERRHGHSARSLPSILCAVSRSPSDATTPATHGSCVAGCQHQRSASRRRLAASHAAKDSHAAIRRQRSHANCRRARRCAAACVTAASP